MRMSVIVRGKVDSYSNTKVAFLHCHWI